MRSNKESIFEIKVVAGTVLLFVVSKLIYSTFEVLRHTALGDDPEHILEHLIAAAITAAVVWSSWGGINYLIRDLQNYMENKS